MNSKTRFSRVLTKGGVLTPSYLNDILNVADYYENDSIFFGSRQDILFKRNEKTELKVVQLKPDKFQSYDRDFPYQNIVSSFVCVDILPSTSWVHSGTYLTILDQIEYRHTLRINLVDPKQNLVPLFYGNLNFIASQTPNYWFLYIKSGENGKAKKWPGLIFSDDIATLAVHLEKIWEGKKVITIDQLIHELPMSYPIHTLESEEELSLPEGFFPYYEGLNKNDGADSYWAGFYWRNNKYPIKFLREVCNLCDQTGVGKICITPWKTFLVKGILPEHKIFWEELIGRYGINMRHSSFELNWHLPILDKQAYKLKKYIVGEFDKFDIRTFGISFTIQTKPMEIFTTVLIKLDSGIKLPAFLNIFQRYSIYYAFDFNPNNNHYVLFEQNITKKEIPHKLNELTKRYYSRISFPGREAWERLNKRKGTQSLVIQQCKNCLTIYDERFGDILADIQAGTAFEELPENYSCQICESPKSNFKETGIVEFV